MKAELLKYFLMLFFVEVLFLGAGYAENSWGKDQTAQLYDQAVHLYQQGAYEKAKVKFIQVKIRQKNYKATEAFLNRIEQHMAYADHLEKVQGKMHKLHSQDAQEASAKRLEKMEQKLKGEEQRKKNQDKAQERLEKRKIQRAKNIIQKQKKDEEALERKQQEQTLSRLAAQERAALKQEKIRAKDALIKQRQEARLGLKKKKYERDLAVHQAQEAYRDVMASYKAKRFDYAWERLADLQTMLNSETIPESFREGMRPKMAAAELRVRKNEQKDQRLKETLSSKNQSRDQQKELSLKPAPAQDSPISQGNMGPKTKILSVKTSPIEVKPHAEATFMRQDFEIVQDQPQVHPTNNRLQQEFDKGLETLYQDGVKLYQVGSLELSRQIFQEILRLKTDYKNSRHYLELIEARQTPESPSPKDKTDVIADALDHAEQEEALTHQE